MSYREGPIETGWKSYFEHVVNPLNSPDQIAEMRRVFYAGAMVSFVAITKASELATEDDGVRFLARIEREIEAFQEELKPHG